jgi:hypothetical protein
MGEISIIELHHMVRFPPPLQSGQGVIATLVEKEDLALEDTTTMAVHHQSAIQHQLDR